MNSFKLTQVHCTACGASQDAPGFAGVCIACRSGFFGVEIDRSSSGVDEENLVAALFEGSSGIVGALVDEASDDATTVFFRTHSVLHCESVPGEDLLRFAASPVEARRRMYVGWKRRELELQMDAVHRICRRCDGIFKVYDNDWNHSGLCSRACHQAHLKSER